MKRTIILKHLYHNNQNRIGITFPADNELNSIIRQVDTCKWSNTHKCWHIADTKENLKNVFLLFKGRAWIDYSGMQTEKEKEPEIQEAPSIKLTLTNELNADTTEKIKKYLLWLRSKRYSESTVKTYKDALQSFLKFYSHKPIADINNNDVIVYNNEYILKNKLSASYQNQVVNAIKLFFKQVENASLDINLVHRPKKPKLLPNVLSKEEIETIIKVTHNLKHRAALILVYSCGLRRGELLNLKLTDIDSKRKLVLIRVAKGNKDRIAPLSAKVIEILREYYLKYKPTVYLFEGETAGAAYSATSLSQVLHRSVAKAGIKKEVSLHWLRHSYATHLLENGTDLRYIQEILGHKSSKTTEIYTHVSTKSLQNIISPFDNMNI